MSAAVTTSMGLNELIPKTRAELRPAANRPRFARRVGPSPGSSDAGGSAVRQRVGDVGPQPAQEGRPRPATT
jgi:hypothetical protein